ncbi:MAG: hypothetical protein P1V51_08425 [Deltaproteobacteria bacterium]|nr:hypothetical protein [Deltaproteobacteria bacterium]
MRATLLLLAALLTLPAPAGAADAGTFQKPEKVKPPKRQPLDERPVCTQQQKTAPLDPEGVYRCRGVPFEVALEPGKTYEQTFGRGWLSIQLGTADSIAVVSYKPAPWVLQPGREKEQESYAKKFLEAIGAQGLVLSEPQPYEQAGAEDARRVEFEFGPPERHFVGESRSFFVRGWFVNMMLAGLEGSDLRRGGKGAKALFASLRVVESPGALAYRFAGGETLDLPPESWLLQGRYYVPSTGAFLSLGEGPSPKPCDALDEADWAKITGDVAPRDAPGKVHFQDSRWLRHKKQRLFLARARTDIGGGKLVPGAAAVTCREGRLYQVFALDTEKRLPDLALDTARLLLTLEKP